MIRGDAGSGKTVLALRFPAAGVENGGSVLFVDLEGDLDDPKAKAAALGFDTERNRPAKGWVDDAEK